MNKYRHSDSTLKGMTKDELIRYIRICEHNKEVAEEFNRQQTENVKDWQPVKHGRWLEIKSTDFRNRETFYKCSLCGRTEVKKEPFCNCGAKMDKGE